MKTKIIIYKEGEYYVARTIGEIDVSSFGSTSSAAIKNVTEALQLYLEEAGVSAISEVKNPEIKDLIIPARA